jgi:hypothetical protein
MIDRIFAATLTFCVLAGGTFAIGSELFGADARPGASPVHVRTVALEPVVITCRSAGSASMVATTGTAGGAARAL